MSRKTENIAFKCVYCGKQVVPLTNGSYRNHCPHCLYSLHVDHLPGDRTNDCKGLMRPVGVIPHSRKGYQIIHRCESCGTEKVNRIAVDTIMPDYLDLILKLMSGHNTEYYNVNRKYKY